VPLWFSKPSQNTAAVGQGPPPGPLLALADGLAEGLLDGLALVLGLALGLILGLAPALGLVLALALGDAEEPPAQDAPLSAKSVGVASLPE
jgi:hypothetical protein